MNRGFSKDCSKEIDASFHAVTTRPPAVYRGNPFQIEVGLAYGHTAGTHLELDQRGRIQKNPRANYRGARSSFRPTSRPICCDLPIECHCSTTRKPCHHKRRRANELAFLWR